MESRDLSLITFDEPTSQLHQPENGLDANTVEKDEGAFKLLPALGDYWGSRMAGSHA